MQYKEEKDEKNFYTFLTKHLLSPSLYATPHR